MRYFIRKFEKIERRRRRRRRRKISFLFRYITNIVK
jgi:hypothetical protein